jgi:hypothetical protein
LLGGYSNEDEVSNNDLLELRENPEMVEDPTLEEVRDSLKKSRKY